MRAKPISLVLVSLALCGCEEETVAETSAGDEPAPTSVVEAPADVPPELTCADTPRCAYDGRCGGDLPDCAAESDEHCQRSQGCKDWGLCSARDGRCIAADKKDCEASYTCKMVGRCSVDQDQCAVVAEDDCRGAYVCQYERKCVAKNGSCRK